VGCIAKNASFRATEAISSLLPSRPFFFLCVLCVPLSNAGYASPDPHPGLLPGGEGEVGCTAKSASFGATESIFALLPSRPFFFLCVLCVPLSNAGYASPDPHPGLLPGGEGEVTCTAKRIRQSTLKPIFSLLLRVLSFKSSCPLRPSLQPTYAAHPRIQAPARPHIPAGRRIHPQRRLTRRPESASERSNYRQAATAGLRESRPSPDQLASGKINEAQSIVDGRGPRPVVVDGR
jgi:hypothetical protein